MEKEIKKIFLTYKVLSEIKQNYNLNIVSETYWKEDSSGIIDGLDDEFENIVNEFKREMSNLACYSTFTSGKDPNRQNRDSLHIVGKAVDIRTYDHAPTPVAPYLTKECVEKALKVCTDMSKKYPGLTCSHERNRAQSSEDFTAPHLHIEYNVGGKTPDGSKPDGSKPEKYRDAYVVDMLSPVVNKLTKPIIGQIVNPLISKVSANVTENFNFGGNSEVSPSGEIIIKANSGSIKSPIDGKAEKNYSFGCKNQIIIKPEDETYKIEFCGISDPSVIPNNVYKGFILGTSTKDVKVTLMNRGSSKIEWNSKSADELIEPKNKYVKRSDRDYQDRFIPDLINIGLDLFKDKSGNFDFVSPTSGKLPQKWKSLTEEEIRLVKDLQRIKQLLK
jgi:hypothetical protein